MSLPISRTLSWASMCPDHEQKRMWNEHLKGKAERECKCRECLNKLELTLKLSELKDVGGHHSDMRAPEQMESVPIQMKASTPSPVCSDPERKRIWDEYWRQEAERNARYQEVMNMLIQPDACEAGCSDRDVDTNIHGPEQSTSVQPQSTGPSRRTSLSSGTAQYSEHDADNELFHVAKRFPWGSDDGSEDEWALVYEGSVKSSMSTRTRPQSDTTTASILTPSAADSIESDVLATTSPVLLSNGEFLRLLNDRIQSESNNKWASDCDSPLLKGKQGRSTNTSATESSTSSTPILLPSPILDASAHSASERQQQRQRPYASHFPSSPQDPRDAPPQDDHTLQAYILSQEQKILKRQWRLIKKWERLTVLIGHRVPKNQYWHCVGPYFFPPEETQGWGSGSDSNPLADSLTQDETSKDRLGHRDGANPFYFAYPPYFHLNFSHPRYSNPWAYYLPPHYFNAGYYHIPSYYDRPLWPYSHTIPVWSQTG
ncbi:uncharacterized protein BP01DRAFT_406702 [Aspergillus saccharolyticus JOP 1030-1]|uniref:Uncharacterized protein n=1 Tax=Aspergillus saccharolyticus JOP 1030-1 TaxID=1450539 RepID=A0A318ZNB1_9EURO|nr:hypothetical protein BP01DRAFT_406702 [Aspergillus saccharolyticus JOP 1030-1]PYH41648.1 hypothetical protein BP01DRAFT_406702 [Aspergillus saccharolyticus JOP 1030-1]